MGHIRVIATDVGGGFGQKAHTYPEEVVLAALLHSNWAGR